MAKQEHLKVGAERPETVRIQAIKVWVYPDEKAAIEANAALTSSRSVSSFLRTLGMGWEPRSTVDKQQVLDLAKVNADQGRLGGLLKMYLTNEERQDARTYAAVAELLDQIRETQAELMRVAKRL